MDDAKIGVNLFRCRKILQHAQDICHEESTLALITTVDRLLKEIQEIRNASQLE
ncbi:MAG: hypothetical protein KGI54_09600 [Pseudomonadota bacterium]|nr:hypothetical protein [Pseudomonadota bacterium]